MTQGLFSHNPSSLLRICPFHGCTLCRLQLSLFHQDTSMWNVASHVTTWSLLQRQQGEWTRWWLQAACIDDDYNDHEPITSNWIQPKKQWLMMPPFQYHNYPKLMSGTCHLQYRSTWGLLRVIAWLALECIWADRIDGRKTQRSVIGDTVLLIYQHKVLRPPWIKICCWSLKKVKEKEGRGREVGGWRCGGRAVICLLTLNENFNLAV